MKSGRGKEAIFQSFSRGVETTRDEWVYDFSENNLEKAGTLLIYTIGMLKITEVFKRSMLIVN
ncbi:MAG: hypothetical protein IPJ90_07595 [Anaerolineaceae bacterium]|nr:hypothetical protein [Anaerolineaceae bacterium]